MDDAVFIGGPEKRDIVIEDYDPAWSARFEQVHAALREALPDRTPDRALRLHRRPRPRRQGDRRRARHRRRRRRRAAYAPALEHAGFAIRLRQPGHRMFRTPEQDVHVHVFSEGSDAARTRLLFRDWLRHDPDDRRLYEDTKRELARREWEATNDYSTAKGAVVAEILAARSAGPA